MSPHSSIIEITPHGLYCPGGGFFVDPWRPVERAVVTHAHVDHVAFGSKSFLTSETGAKVLRARVGGDVDISAWPYGKSVRVGEVSLSLHPAGHVLGSAQVRIERGGEVWVISGDYKTQYDRTCEPFEPVPCHTYITESTFGLPIYRWPDEAEVFADLNAWWRANRDAGRTSVVFAYALGKAQRVLGGLDPSIGPVAVHGAIEPLNEVYRAAGIDLPEAPRAVRDGSKAVKGAGLVIAPQAALGSRWMRALAGPGGIATAMASGWMIVRGRRRWRGIDRGFVLSDHADWPGLHWAIEQTGAERVGVTHGQVEPMVRWLREQGKDAFAVPTRWVGEVEDLAAEADEGTPEI